MSISLAKKLAIFEKGGKRVELGAGGFDVVALARGGMDGRTVIARKYFRLKKNYEAEFKGVKRVFDLQKDGNANATAAELPIC